MICSRKPPKPRPASSEQVVKTLPCEIVEKDKYINERNGSKAVPCQRIAGEVASAIEQPKYINEVNDSTAEPSQTTMSEDPLGIVQKIGELAHTPDHNTVHCSIKTVHLSDCIQLRALPASGFWSSEEQSVPQQHKAVHDQQKVLLVSKGAENNPGVKPSADCKIDPSEENREKN